VAFMNDHTASRAIAAFTAIGCLVASVSPRAQGLRPSEIDETFDVASIKPSTETRIPLARVLPSGHVQIIGVTLRDLIRMAYTSRAGQVDVEGGPGWIGNDRFDVVANAPMNRPPTTSMLRSLLTARFQLRVHTDTREGATFVLMTARADGQLGASLTPSTCGVSGHAQCGSLRIAAGPALIGQGVTMPDLAAALSNFPVLGGPVVDRTNVAGAFDLQIRFRGATNPNPDDGPLLPDALKEQLGLKVERSTGRRDIVVIDSVARPDPN
jgi:uncharacterized protein (TIGR03435 family)